MQAQSTSLLGLIGLSTLGVMDFGTQDINAGDADGDLTSVEIKYTALLGLGTYTLSASTALAAELGLEVNVVNDPGVLGLISPSSTMMITAVGGGDIDNLDINELLASVQFNSGGSVISPALLTLNVLSATTVTAEDSEGQTTSATVSSLVDVSALDTLLGDNSIQEGTSGNDTLTGTADSHSLYGFDGNDTLSGSDGQDLIRGGGGDDQLNGGAETDLLIGGEGNDTLQGDAGADIFRWESGDEGTVGSTAQDTVNDFDTSEGDVLDLRDLLSGEESGDLLDYLDFNFNGSDTEIAVSVDGSGDVTQNIILQNVELTAANTLSNQQVIDSLLADNNLITD